MMILKKLMVVMSIMMWLVPPPFPIPTPLEHLSENLSDSLPELSTEEDTYSSDNDDYEEPRDKIETDLDQDEEKYLHLVERLVSASITPSNFFTEDSDNELDEDNPNIDNELDEGAPSDKDDIEMETPPDEHSTSSKDFPNSWSKEVEEAENESLHHPKPTTPPHTTLHSSHVLNPSSTLSRSLMAHIWEKDSQFQPP